MSSRNHARFIRRKARGRGLDDRYARILHLVRVHHDEIMRHKHDSDEDLSWNEAAWAVVSMHLLPKERAS